jgi:tRNA A-37 threonylcarbamoyl transferase component Bud32
MSVRTRQSEPGLGRLELLAADSGLACAAITWARPHLRTRPRLAAAALLEGERAWGKAEPLPAKAALRHSLRHHLLRRPLPRVAEFSNLAWLRRHCFEAPAPLAAGVLFQNGVPRWQFLLTREVPAAVSLERLLDEPPSVAEVVLGELADEVARMHALGFIHRDLFPRNLLVREEPAARRLVFLDAWRGGPHWQLRGYAYDLAGLLLHLSRWIDAEAETAWLERYAAQRAVQGRPVEWQQLLRLVESERRAFVERYRRRGRGAELQGLRER